MLNKRYVIFLSLLVLMLLICYPAINSYFYSDDFFFLAVSRYIHNPLYFLADHFPGSLYYRPSGQLFWWLTYQLFGINHYLHNITNLVLHVLVATLFYRLLRFFNNPPGVSLVVAALFLTHPTTIATALWLSNRFDLLATLFCLISLLGTLHYLQKPHYQYLCLSLLGALLAITSKELAYLLPIVTTVAVVTFSYDNRRPLLRNGFLIIGLHAALALILLLIRFRVLRWNWLDAYQENGLLAIFYEGFSQWLGHLIPFYSYGFQPYWTLPLVLVTGTTVLTLVIIAYYQRHFPTFAFAIGVTLALLPGILQAPVIHYSTISLPDIQFSSHAFFAARFYYLSLLGFMIVLCQLLTMVFADWSTTRFKKFLVFSSLVGLGTVSITFAKTSHISARHWSLATNGEDRRIVQQANQTITKLAPIRGSKIYLLNTPPTAFYFRDFADVIVKAVAPATSDIIHCLVQSEKAPWYHLILRKDYADLAISPLRPMTIAEKPFAPTYLDNLVYLYLIIPDSRAVTLDSKALFLAFNGQTLNDVTRAVRTGKYPVHFFNDRPAL
jgi:hypothetical protein